LIKGKKGREREIEDVLELVQLGSKSSVAKFGRMVGRADDDDSRVRGAFVYAGASQTLRYASRGLQLHNMARDCFGVEQTEDLIEQMREGYILEDDHGDLPVMQTLSKLLRPALIPAEGKVFVVGDWSSIEARALPWLAKSEYAKARLELFKQDVDIYVNTAEELGLGDRQIGKVAELSLGYGGALGAFNSMAKNYGVELDDMEVAKIVTAWRSKNVWCTIFWKELAQAATLAIRNPGKEQTAGRVKYLYIEGLIEGTLLCILPGDLVIQYPKAKLESTETKWGPRLNITAMKANWHPKQDEKDWPRIALWPGLLAENVTQAFCAGILRHSLRRSAYENHPVVGHVHDEIILEVDVDEQDIYLRLLKSTMEDTPSWAKGLPLKAEPVAMTRYGK
jgi:DNA polymerase